LYESDPLPKAIELNGLFSARLDFTVNKMDMDLNIILYEHMANGEYIRLFSPTNEARASYARDRAHRHLLKAGERQTVSFRAERMTSRLLQPGSRLVVILGISKRPGSGDQLRQTTAGRRCQRQPRVGIADGSGNGPVVVASRFAGMRYLRQLPGKRSDTMLPH
jgi:hypothetical protein